MTDITPTEPVIEMTVLTENDPEITQLVCQIAEHMTTQGGNLVVTRDRKGAGYLAGYHFAAEEPGSEMAGGAAYGVGPTITDALTQVIDQVGLPRTNGGPTLTLSASQVLSSAPADDIGHQVQSFLSRRDVQEWLRARAKTLVDNPLMFTHPDRERWVAFATVRPEQQVRRGH